MQQTKKGHVYILSNKKFPQNVYEIGGTENLASLLTQRSKNARFPKLTEVADAPAFESKLLDVFREKFEVRGVKKFKGDISEMMKEFDSVCDKQKRQRAKKYLPNFRETWVTGGSRRNALSSMIRKRVGYVWIEDPLFERFSGVSADDKVIIIGAHASDVEVHRIGPLCFMRSTNLGYSVRRARGKLATIVDLGHRDVHFEVLRCDMPGDWILCLAKKWSFCLALKPDYFGSFEKHEALKINNPATYECFGEDSECDVEVSRCLSSFGWMPGDTMLEYLVDDLEACMEHWEERFSMEIFVKCRKHKETEEWKREPLSPIKRSYCADRIHDWITEFSIPSEKFEYGMKFFDIDFPLRVETETQRRDFDEWRKNPGCRFFPDFAISRHVYAACKTDNSRKWDGPSYPEKYGKYHPWALKRTKISKDILPLSHKNPCKMLFMMSCSFPVLMDIIIHCEKGPVFISLFDSRKITGRSCYETQHLKKISSAVYLVDVNDVLSLGETPKEFKRTTVFEKP
ncbi:putative conserved domain protein [Cannes 8 virus]|nr:putative conserved domain protein [Cannes 8 virus]